MGGVVCSERLCDDSSKEQLVEVNGCLGRQCLVPHLLGGGWGRRDEGEVGEHGLALVTAARRPTLPPGASMLLTDAVEENQDNG